MNVPKPVYLMAGGREGKSYRRIMQEVVAATGKEKPAIAYVGAASGENYAFFLMISGIIKSAVPCTLKRIVIAGKKTDIDKAKRDLESSDAIFMSGGDVEAGMQVLKEKELIQYFRDLFDRGKVFFGASAGSIMLAKQWVRWDNPDDDATASLFPCLGFAPLICDTHAEADDWEELKAELKLDTEGTIGYGIMSGSCLKVFPDGKIEAVAGPINRYTRNSGGIVKLPDLLPEKK